MRTPLVLALALLVSAPSAAVMLMQLSPDAPPAASETQPLPKIAPAPEFTLTSQDDAQISLTSLRGKVVAVTFIFTRCTATCPVLTPMMPPVQGLLRTGFPVQGTLHLKTAGCRG